MEKTINKFYPDLNLTEKDISDIKIFKAPFVEPIYPLGYSKTKTIKLKVDTKIFFATSAQVYPNITSWNASTGLAAKVVDLLLELENKPK